tara:strand:- start:109 stop:678 length:570 start_codon:yes stop_codon:yes gene_type:complete
MKKIILIIGILIGLAIGASSQYMGGKTRSETHKRVTKKTYERNLTNELVKYIETGDLTPLLDLVQEEDITFIGLSGDLYVPSENKEYFIRFIKEYLDVRSKDLTILRIDKEYYDNYYSPAGGMYKITILYPNSERYDNIDINYNNEGKLMGITINDNLHKYRYVDGDKNKIYGCEYGYEGEKITHMTKL